MHYPIIKDIFFNSPYASENMPVTDEHKKNCKKAV